MQLESTVTTGSPRYREWAKESQTQPPGVRLIQRNVHRGIIFEILAKGRKSP